MKIDSKVLMPILLSALVGVIGWLFNTIEELQIAHSSMMEQLRILRKRFRYARKSFYRTII